jgi:methylthioxylose transferase
MTDRRRTLAAVGGWTAVLIAGALVGRALYAEDFLIRIGNAPIAGTADLRLSTDVVPAALFAIVAVLVLPRLAAGLAWPRLLAASALGAAAWIVLLALTDGTGALTAPLESRYEYLAAVDRVGSPTAFLSSFTDVLASYPTHVKGHPPALVLLLAGMDAVGLGGSGWAAALVIGGGALAVPAALVAHRALAGERRARAAAPFLVLLPGAVWLGTSADALFTGVAAAGIALFAVAASAPAGRRADVLAVAAGVVLALALHLSYGIAPLGAVVLAIAAWRGAWRVTALAAAGLALVFASFVAAGFWWLAGLDATRELYHAGVASRRPYLEFVLIDVAAFCLVVGPAAAVGLGRLRDRGTWVLCGGAVVALSAAALSGLSRGETERIWLPFAPWIVLATCALGSSRRWLASAAALGFVVQVGARSPW